MGGKFSDPQKRFYEGVLKVQKDCVNMVKPGVKLPDIHSHAISGLTEVMLELGLLKGKKNEPIEKKAFFKYYPHGTSHSVRRWTCTMLGLYSINGSTKARKVCFTVEPAPEDDKEALAEYRGLGVRIEDDVIVTQNGCDVLTKSAPKEVSELEAIIGKSV